jgi:hypothetical protein
LKKSNVPSNYEDSSLIRKGNEETLEISSTGYGLESVSNEGKKPEEQAPSCGGL